MMILIQIDAIVCLISSHGVRRNGSGDAVTADKPLRRVRIPLNNRPAPDEKSDEY